MEMDIDVTPLRADAVDAGMIPKDGKRLVVTALSNEDYSKGNSTFEITYDFGHTNSVHMWKHPCIATIECEISDTAKGGFGSIWVIMAIVGGILVGVMIVVFCVVYCAKAIFKPNEVVEPVQEVSPYDDDIDFEKANHAMAVTNSTMDIRDVDNFSEKY